MVPDKKELYEGVKTFFVAPDTSLMPAEFLPHFFLKGYEVYYLDDDQKLPLERKVDVLFGAFKELILFFNIDRRIEGVAWADFIRAVKAKYGERARIGVLYGSHVEAAARRDLEKLFLFDIGIDCGCIPLEYRKAQNLARLSGVLAANQANGRRKSLRAVCGSRCTFNFVREGVTYQGEIRDVSVSHFTGVFVDGDPRLAMYDKIQGIQLKLAGIICMADAIVFMKRVVGKSLFYVFVFRSSLGRDGPSPDALAKINGYIHASYEQGVREITRKAFEDAGAGARPSRES